MVYSSYYYNNISVLCIFTLFLHCMAILNTTSSITPNGSTSSFNSTVQENDTKPLVLNVKRKAYLIINPGMGLRSGNQQRPIDSLLYVEYDAKGNVLNRFPMRSLADVRNFFNNNPEIQICYDHCPGDNVEV